MKYQFSEEESKKWADEWRLITELIRLNAGKRGIDLSKIRIVEG